MDVTKVFDYLTWDDVVIEKDELKSIGEFTVQDLKRRDLWAVCSQLKIKGVKNTMKDSMLEKIVSVYKLKEGMVGLRMTQSHFSHWQERSPSALTDYWTFYFLICSLRSWCNLGMWPTSSILTQAKHPTINYFGKASKKPSQATRNYMTIYILRMTSLVSSIMLTSRR